MKNFSSITENLDITTKKYVDDNKVTSVDGLSGGTLTSPLKVSGGNQSTASKISLDQSANGQITDSGTSTLFGFMSSTTLTIGDNSYALALRGSGKRPTYKGVDLALYSDIATVPTDYVKYTAQDLTDAQKSQARTNIGVPTKTSELTNDSEFITSNDSVKSVIDYNATNNRIKIGYSGAGISGDSIRYIAGYTTGDSESAASIKDIDKASMKNWLGYATVAESGSYNDLSDKLDIVQTTGASTTSVMSQNATTNAISGKLDKTKYEVNKTINFGQDGALYIGKFKVYDTNVTFEITSTTSVTYSGKLVIATQNYVIKEMTVYGDAANTVAPNIYIKPSTTSDPYIEVYFKPESWSKNVVHIYGSNIQATPTDVCTNVPSVPSTATLKPKNALPIYSLSGTTLTITM